MASEVAREARNAYMRAYRMKNKDRLNEQARMRRKENPEKYRQYMNNYWERKAQCMEGCEA